MARTARISSPHTSVRCCGTVKREGQSAEVWRGDGGRVHVRGTFHCASPWQCPECASRIGRERAEDLEKLRGAHLAAGGDCYHITLTVPHECGLPLKELRAHVSDAWRYCVSGAPWKRLAARLGVVGFVRALDVTVGGANGWHPHLHVLLFTAAPLAVDDLLKLNDWLFSRWCRAVARPVKGIDGGKLDAPSRERGVIIRRAVLASYLAQASICWSDELASETMKVSRSPGHSTPWQLLRGIALGLFPESRSMRRAIDWWLEWAYAMRGARQLTYSRGLRERYGLRNPLPDADAISQQLTLELGETPRCRFIIPRDSWNKIVLPSPKLHTSLLSLAADLTVSDLDAQLVADDLISAFGLLRRSG